MKNPLGKTLIPSFLSSERLEMLPITLDMAFEMNKAIHESAAEFQPRFAWANPALPSLTDTQNFILACIKEHLNKEGFHFAIYSKDESAFVGYVSLAKSDPSLPAFTFGYWCRTSQTGHGYMSEAVIAVTDFAINILKARRLMISPDETNMASRSIAEKLVKRYGFKDHGVMKNSWRSPHNGKLCNCVRYIFTQPD